MSSSKINTRLKWLVRDQLNSFGFELIKPRVARRLLPEGSQSIELQPGTGHLKGKYTMNIFLSFEFLDSELRGFRSGNRIGRILKEPDFWYSTEGDLGERQYKALCAVTKAYVIPYLQKYDSIRSIFEGVESGDLSLIEAFGSGIVNQHCGYAECLIHFGRPLEAVNELHSALECLPNHPEQRLKMQSHIQALLKRIQAS